MVNFLANQFTNVELYEWMRGVLGRVYAYFLQQATAIAQLAQAQLAFERQEPAPGFVCSDYWQDTADNSADDGSGAPVDRRGLTGSARLLQDIYRLDQYAFETDRRKLHLTQTLSLAQIAALELQQFRDTGLLVFSTPMDLFDREFPGHYLRLIKRVRVSMIALVPPVRGVRATLSASGLSRVIVAGDEFVPVLLSRSPEAIALHLSPERDRFVRDGTGKRLAPAFRRHGPGGSLATGTPQAGESVRLSDHCRRAVDRSTTRP